MTEQEIRIRVRLHRKIFDSFQIEAASLTLPKDRGGQGLPLDMVAFEAVSFGLKLGRAHYGQIPMLELLRVAVTNIEKGTENLWEDLSVEDGR